MAASKTIRRLVVVLIALLSADVPTAASASAADEHVLRDDPIAIAPEPE